MKTSNSANLVRMPKFRAALPFVVETRILFLRHHRVILDSDIAELYGVSVKRLNEQVKRNQERFPSDFMFQLSEKEYAALRSQIATSKKRGGRRYMPYAFTEHGAIMPATRAIQMSLFVVRAFVRLRDMLATNRRLAAKVYELENRLDTHDSTIQDLIDVLKRLVTPPRHARVRIGFQLPAAKAKS